jgi:hypothetical protein
MNWEAPWQLRGNKIFSTRDPNKEVVSDGSTNTLFELYYTETKKRNHRVLASICG